MESASIVARSSAANGPKETLQLAHNRLHATGVNTAFDSLLDSLLEPFFLSQSFCVTQVCHLLLLLELIHGVHVGSRQLLRQRHHPVQKAIEGDHLGAVMAATVEGFGQVQLPRQPRLKIATCGAMFDVRHHDHGQATARRQAGA